MHPLTILVCGNAQTTGDLGDVIKHQADTLDKLLVRSFSLRNSLDKTDIALFGPVLGRGIIEIAFTSILARFDPFRILSILKSQQSSKYDITSRNPLAFNWRSDVQGDSLPKEWNGGPALKDLQRALLGKHFHDIFWREAYENLVDYVPSGRGKSWMREISLYNPDHFTDRLHL